MPMGGRSHRPASSVTAVNRVMSRLRPAIDQMEDPAVEKIAEDQKAEPLQVLIATMLSAQTKDAVTFEASTRLFKRAATPRALARMRVREIQQLIYPVSFYRNKARHVRETCRQLLERFGGRVPTTMTELLTLPGVGRKTANLVLIVAHQSASNICVDTHVHRISQPSRVGEDAHAGTDRAGTLRCGATPMVVVDQPIPGDLGPERVSAGVSLVRSM